MLCDESKVINMEDFSSYDVYIPQSFSDLKNSVVYNNGIYYFYKNVWDDRIIINELIGSYLAKLLDLEAVDYKIGVYNNKKYILSEIFFDDNFNYLYPKNLYIDYELIEKKKVTYINNIPDNYANIRDKILKLSILDIKMCQYDRGSFTNVMLKASKISNYLDLAPIYDFGLSYPVNINKKELKYYYNPYLIIRKNKKSLSMLLKEYPQTRNYVEIIENIKMPSILSVIEEENKIKVDDSIRKDLIAKDIEYSKVLQKL